MKPNIKLIVRFLKLTLSFLKEKNIGIIKNKTAKKTLTVMRELNITLYDSKIVIIKCK